MKNIHMLLYMYILAQKKVHRYTHAFIHIINIYITYDLYSTYLCSQRSVLSELETNRRHGLEKQPCSQITKDKQKMQRGITKQTVKIVSQMCRGRQAGRLVDRL